MDRVTRAAFIYLDPKIRDDKATFAQCGACRMFVPELGRCIIHGSHVDVDADDTCGFFVDWPYGRPNPEVVKDHAAELKKDIPGSVTPEESGFVDELVQCHRCEFFNKGDSTCGLYQRLNATNPHHFDLDPHVSPAGCCNAWTKKEKAVTKQRGVVKSMRKATPNG